MKEKYVSNDLLKGELIHHFKTGEITDKLHFMILEMCKRIGTKPNFCNYTYKEDMVFNSYCKCIDVISRGKFNITRQNAFGYFSTVIHNCFLDTLWREKKQRNIKMDLKDYVYSNLVIRYPAIDCRMLMEEGETQEE